MVKLLPQNHVNLFRDLLALAEKHNVKFQDSEYDECHLTIDSINYRWLIEGDKVVVFRDGRHIEAENLAQEAFAGEVRIVTGKPPGENVIFMQAGASYWATIEITKDTVREFAHCSAFIGTEPPYTRETRTKELK